MLLFSSVAVMVIFDQTHEKLLTQLFIVEVSQDFHIFEIFHTYTQKKE